MPVWGIGGCRGGASASRAKVLAVVWHQPASKTWPYLAASGDQDIPKPRRSPQMGVDGIGVDRQSGPQRRAGARSPSCPSNSQSASDWLFCC